MWLYRLTWKCSCPSNRDVRFCFSFSSIKMAENTGRRKKPSADEKTFATLHRAHTKVLEEMYKIEPVIANHSLTQATQIVKPMDFLAESVKTRSDVILQLFTHSSLFTNNYWSKYNYISARWLWIRNGDHRLVRSEQWSHYKWTIASFWYCFCSRHLLYEHVERSSSRNTDENEAQFLQRHDRSSDSRSRRSRQQWFSLCATTQ